MLRSKKPRLVNRIFLEFLSLSTESGKVYANNFNPMKALVRINIAKFLKLG